MDGLQPCSHEEADTRILIHVKDAMNSGYKDAIIRTTDTDIVVPAVAYFQDWKTSETSGLLLAQGKISDIYQCMS